MSKINLLKLSDYNSWTDFILICCSSFENRSLEISKQISKKCSEVIVFANKDTIPQNITNANKIFDYAKSKTTIVQTKHNDPIYTTRKIINIFQEIIKKDKKVNLVIDVTTFTHEMLLILYNIVSLTRNKYGNILALYCGASEYSQNEKTKDKWLSKGCKEVRTIIGFPGEIVSNKPTALTVLVGFEHERAASLIDIIEPDLLFLANGVSCDEGVTNVSHREPMEYFAKLLDEMIYKYDERAQKREFLCTDIDNVTNMLNKIVNNNTEYNHIIVPLNTKLSTIAAGKVAYENKSIQLCYAVPELYNLEGYSVPDDIVTIVEL